MGREIKVYFCPKCNSTNVRFIFGLRNFLGVIPRQKCFNCGFESNGFPVAVINKKDVEKMNKMVKKNE